MPSTFPDHLTLLGLFIWKKANYGNSLTVAFCKSYLGTDIPLRSLFSNTPILRCYLNARGPISHQYKSAGNITFSTLGFR
jgi:hypothetical protein